jgi:hypothetical protein
VWHGSGITATTPDQFKKQGLQVNMTIITSGLKLIYGSQTRVVEGYKKRS